MTKRLYIRYGDLELHDGEVDEFAFSESAGSISVTGKVKPAGKSGVADLLGALAGASKQRTANEVVRRRNELDAEKEENE